MSVEQRLWQDNVPYSAPSSGRFHVLIPRTCGKYGYGLGMDYPDTGKVTDIKRGRLAWIIQLGSI